MSEEEEEDAMNIVRSFAFRRSPVGARLTA